MTKVLKAGSKVRIVAGYLDHHGFKVGSIVTLLHDVREGDYASARGKVEWTEGRYQSEDGTQGIMGRHYVAVRIDFTKPVFTAEGTPVQIVTTTGRDAKFPVLGYEGKATILSKFSLEGKNKNGTARRHLTNEQPKDEAPVETPVANEYFVNLYEEGELRDNKGRMLTPGGIIGNQRYNSEEACNADYGRNKAADKNALTRVGVAKIIIVRGRMPRAN